MGVTVMADFLGLSTGLVADKPGNAQLARTFGLDLTADGFFQEDHVKFNPVNMALPGFYVAGTAHSPKLVRESISQACAAVSKARALLADESICLKGARAEVEKEKCAACLVCVRACPYHIPRIGSEGYSEIDPAQCRGCGLCAAECPAKAIQLLQYEDDRILAKIEDVFASMEA
ncbi:unnamed protein product [Cyprideis torosa]|uniref:Uncharacterized protein n=1 Tax=Cyprideis torosa TaxID=163714 RepID=A0A7R8X338_9CRUS|nr:unnamed protein product [Cyprideis torosa]CAG0911150.1 unnamed protein product [Cyprideis torosa]